MIGMKGRRFASTKGLHREWRWISNYPLAHTRQPINGLERYIISFPVFFDYIITR